MIRGPGQRVLIVGCGYVGTALGMRLVGEGHVVWAMRRDETKLPTSFNRIQADIIINPGECFTHIKGLAIPVKVAVVILGKGRFTSHFTG